MKWFAPKGTRDFYPEDMVLREHLFKSWEKSCKKYGFEPFDAPVFEHLELYTQKSGQEIEKQLYLFEDKSGRKLALRPELTPSLARMVAARGTELKKPLKWYSIPKLFRYEKMQKGRLREFFQLNMDILGIDCVSADAELIAAAIDLLRDLGLTADDFKVHISSRTLLEELFLSIGVAKETLPNLYSLLDRMPKMDANEFYTQIENMLDNKELSETVQRILSAKNLGDIEAINDDFPALTDLKTLFSYLAALGFKNYVLFDISIVRGLAYYTGIVFEIFDTQRTMRAIAGGGRYDTLVSLYGGPMTPAIGFAAGDVVLSDLLREKGIIPTTPARCDLFIVSFEKQYEKLLKTAYPFRSAGISCEYPLKLVNIAKQLKQADATHAPLVLFCGGEEEEKGMYKLKNMKSGDETLIQINNASSTVLDILKEIR